MQLMRTLTARQKQILRGDIARSRPQTFVLWRVFYRNAERWMEYYNATPPFPRWKRDIWIRQARDAFACAVVARRTQRGAHLARFERAL